MNLGHVPDLGDYVGTFPPPLCDAKHQEYDLVCTQPLSGHNPEVHAAASAGIVFATWPVIL